MRIGRETVENDYPVLQLIDGKYQVGYLYFGKFQWSFSTLFDTWQAAINDKTAVFGFFRGGFFYKPLVQDKDGLYYTITEMEEKETALITAAVA